VAAIAREAKTSNNWMGFERGFWERKLIGFSHVPQTRVFGTILWTH
jgi:hypothetical protein